MGEKKERKKAVSCEFIVDGSRVEEVELVWLDDVMIQVNPNLKLPEMELTNTSTRNCTEVFITGKCYGRCCA